MKKLILLIIIFALFSPLKSEIWEKAEGPYKYVYIYSIFTFNDELFSSEANGLEKAYKYNENGWDRLDTGFFSDKGIVRQFDQKGDIIFSSIRKKMYLSYDAGKSWKKFDNLNGNTTYNTVAIVDSTIFLQANEFTCLHKLVKGSDTLEKVHLSDSKVDSIYADKIISNGDYLFAADKRDHFIGADSEGKLYISKDKGKTWNLSENMKEQINNLLYHNNSLLAFTDDNKLFISKDYGENWTNDTSINFNVKKVISYKDKIFACGNQINISTDNGVTWEVSKNNGLDYYQSCDDLLVNNDTLYYLSSRYIVFYSTDEGKQWIRKSPMSDDIHQISVLEVRDTLFSSGGFTINYSTDNGKSWKMYSDSLYFQYSFLREINIKDSIFVLVNDSYSAIYISTNYGESWRYDNLGIQSSESWIHSVIVFGKRIIVSGSYGNSISEDLGLTWNEYDDKVLKKDTRINTYFRFSENELILYGLQGLYITYDNGLTWEYEETDGNSRVNDYSSKEGNIIYTIDIGNHKIFKSNDLGRTWTNLNVNIATDLYWTHLIPYNGSLILLTITDVFVTNNDGKDWIRYEVDLLMPNGKKLFFHSGIVSNDYLVLTSENGMWRAKLSDLGIEVKSSVESEIERNYLYTFPPYPNPAKSEVKVLFYWDINLPMTTDDISIYDITGKKIDAVGKLSLVKLESHYGNLIWDCSSAQPGIYLINIKHGTEEKAVKVVVE